MMSNRVRSFFPLVRDEAQVCSKQICPQRAERRAAARPLSPKPLLRLLYVVAIVLHFTASTSSVLAAEQVLNFRDVGAIAHGKTSVVRGSVSASESSIFKVGPFSQLNAIVVTVIPLSKEKPVRVTMRHGEKAVVGWAEDSTKTGAINRKFRVDGNFSLEISTAEPVAAYLMVMFVRNELLPPVPVFTMPSTAQKGPKGDRNSEKQQSERIAGPNSGGVCTVGSSDSTSGNVRQDSDSAIREATLESLRELLQDATLVAVGVVTPAIEHSLKEVWKHARGGSNTVESKGLTDFIREVSNISVSKSVNDIVNIVFENKSFPFFAGPKSCQYGKGPAIPKLPISHPEKHPRCVECFAAAYAKINDLRGRLEQIQCHYSQGKAIRDDALAMMSGVGGIAGNWGSALVLGPRHEIREMFIKQVFSTSHKANAILLTQLEQALIELSNCEHKYTGFSGWYERFGFMFMSNMTGHYRIEP